MTCCDRGSFLGLNVCDGRGSSTERVPNLAGIPFVFYTITQCVPGLWDYTSD